MSVRYTYHPTKNIETRHHECLCKGMEYAFFLLRMGCCLMDLCLKHFTSIHEQKCMHVLVAWSPRSLTNELNRFTTLSIFSKTGTCVSWGHVSCSFYWRHLPAATAADWLHAKKKSKIFPLKSITVYVVKFQTLTFPPLRWKAEKWPVIAITGNRKF